MNYLALFASLSDDEAQDVRAAALARWRREVHVSRNAASEIAYMMVKELRHRVRAGRYGDIEV